MRDEQNHASRRRLLRYGLIAPLALSSIGCGGPAKRIRRIGLMRRVGTTIGRNLDEAPAGQTIPASGLGVDLVGGSAGETRIDGALGAASMDAPNYSARTR